MIKRRRYWRSEIGAVDVLRRQGHRNHTLYRRVAGDVVGLLGSVHIPSVRIAEVGSLSAELISIHEPQTLFARLKSSGKDLGEGVMAGGAGEAYASLARRYNEST